MSDNKADAAELLRANAAKRQAAACKAIEGAVTITTDVRVGVSSSVGWTKIDSVKLEIDGKIAIKAHESHKERGVQIKVEIDREAVAAMVSLMLARPSKQTGE